MSARPPINRAASWATLNARTTHLAGLGWHAGRPVAFLSSECASCEATPRRVMLTNANQPELIGLIPSERREVAEFLANQANQPTPPRAA